MEKRNIQNISADFCNYYSSKNAPFDEELKNEKAKHRCCVGFPFFFSDAGKKTRKMFEVYQNRRKRRRGDGDGGDGDGDGGSKASSSLDATLKARNLIPTL